MRQVCVQASVHLLPAVYFFFHPELLLHAYSAVADSIYEACQAEVDMCLPRPSCVLLVQVIQIGKSTYNKLILEGYVADREHGVLTPPGPLKGV